jgi:uncharacterized membrane protein YhaH (DUF805 family)
MGSAVKSAFSQYATFSGRASRSEFWWFYLFYVIVIVILNVIDNLLNLQVGASTMDFRINDQVVPIVNEGVGILSSLASLAMLLPFLAVGARRLHDAGHSGMWLLWGWLLTFVCCIGFIILIVFWTQRSIPADDKYGPVPTS